MIRTALTAATVVACCAIFLARTGMPGHTAPLASPYGQFAGQWFHHGGGLVIGPGGHGVHHYRTYIDCTNNRLTACDRIIGNTIYDGGYTVFNLQRVNGNSATGTVTQSAYSWQIDTPVSVTRTTKDTLIVKTVDVTFTVCGPHAAPGACGA